jgi:hypothetical protein
MEMSVLRREVEPAVYTKAVQAATSPWNQRHEQRAAASTTEFGRPAACLSSRPKPRTVSTQAYSIPPRLAIAVIAGPFTHLPSALPAAGKWRRTTRH